LRLLIAGLWAAAVWAGGTQAWEMTSWRDFLAGEFRGVAVTRDGRLTVAPVASTLFEDGQSAIWCSVRGRDGTLYFGTGNRGRVIRLDPRGQATVWWTAPEPQVFALALDEKGTLYAATSPSGKIYRVEGGAGAVYFDPGEKYIWSLAFGPGGVLYAGTGERGRIFAVTAANRGELWFDSGQSHITALAVDAGGRLLAGSDPNGILYRVSGKDRAFVVYDAELPEIRAIRVGEDGRIYAAAVGGSVANRAAMAAQGGGATAGGVVSGPATTITVEAQAGIEVKPQPDPAKPQTAAAPAPAPAMVEVTGVEKSAIYRIAASGAVETMWSSKEENAFDVALRGENLWFSTDGAGRIYEVDPQRRIRLITQTNEGEITRLLEADGRMVAATLNQGKILAIGGATAMAGSYESPVHDGGSISRWGRLDWNANGDGKVVFQTRSGNSARPDRTWSDWSAPMASPGPVTSPAARFVQWRAEFTGRAPEVDSVTLAYRPQNNAPSVKSLTVASQLAPAAASQKPPATPSGAAYSITVTDSGDSGASTLSGTATQNPGRPGARQLVVSWTAEDLDGDPLTYTLMFRGDAEREWKLLKSGLTDAFYVIDGDSLADGRYFFRVTASDKTANPPEDAREDEFVSSPVRIDNTPPVVELRRESNRVLAQARDATSPLRRCEVSLNAGPWFVVEAEDGVTDSLEERFAIDLRPLAAGEHLLTVRVTDAAGNPGLAKLVIQN
jgi:outer membrane protein assembly factor BamB